MRPTRRILIFLISFITFTSLSANYAEAGLDGFDLFEASSNALSKSYFKDNVLYVNVLKKSPEVIISIFDVTGRKVHSVSLNNGETEYMIDMSTYKRGIYFLHVVSMSERQIKKIVRCGYLLVNLEIKQCFSAQNVLLGDI